MSKTAWFVSTAVLGVTLVAACGGSPAPEPAVAQPVGSASAKAELPSVETAGTTAVSTPPATPAPTEPPTAAPARGKRSPCVLGRDQTCNGNPSVSAIWGKCTEAGTCECKPGFTLAPTGYCQPQSDQPAQ